MTPYQQHVSRWKNCCKCLLHEHRHKVVIARGKVPAEILFLGEAPGDSEDVIGLPFTGPAGKLLDHIIKLGLDGQYDYAITNLVCCIPKDASNSKGEPPKESIIACRPRLTEFIDLCHPRLIIAVGTLSQRNCPTVDGVARANILHPAAILRMDASQQSLAIKRCIVTVESAAATYL